MRWMSAAARMTVVPGKTGRTVPINPTANKTTTISQQRSSMGLVMTAKFLTGYNANL